MQAAMGDSKGANVESLIQIDMQILRQELKQFVNETQESLERERTELLSKYTALQEELS
jgi:hypothetical protein